MLFKRALPIFVVCCFFFVFYSRFPASERKSVSVPLQHPLPNSTTTSPIPFEVKFDWALRDEKFPVTSIQPLPTGKPKFIPAIQYAFGYETTARTAEISRRRDAVKKTFDRAWDGYKSKAWMKDEIAPVSGTSKNRYGGWAATLVDSLDTLLIMGKDFDFGQAVGALRDIDFTRSEDEELNTFETTIRYLGGLLSANDLCNGSEPILLEKALELGHLLYASFDTPNRMPLTRWEWARAKSGEAQENNHGVLIAEIGSFSLEFTRLSQVSGDPKFYDAIQRVSDRLEESQQLTDLKGVWPTAVDPTEKDFGGGNSYSIGAQADSAYEYFPKQYMLLGGLSDQPRKLYENFINTAKKHFFFRPMVPDEADILISGNVRLIDGNISLDPQGQHLACFVGGMVALGSRIFNRPEELFIARRLTDGCIWAYNAMPSGIMPEAFHAHPCVSRKECKWDAKVAETLEDFPGFTGIGDTRYVLRPEAIESVFILYRITGDERLRDDAWKMFQSIEKHTKTEFGSAAIHDVTSKIPMKTDSMESFWTAETLKYFYLIFSPPDLISLDEFVFNTEAHPFRRPG